MRVLFTQKFKVYRLNDVSLSDKEVYSYNGEIKGYLAPVSAEQAMLTEGNPAQTYNLITDFHSDIKKTDRINKDNVDYIITGIQKIDFGATRRIEAIAQLFNS
jgi:hypothetical protein